MTSLMMGWQEETQEKEEIGVYKRRHDTQNAEKGSGILSLETWIFPSAKY
jgi:hypothetical protein